MESPTTDAKIPRAREYEPEPAKMNGAFPSSGEIELDWPASRDAREYRLVLRNLKTGGTRELMRGDSPRFIVSLDMINSSNQYEWKIQCCETPGKGSAATPWRNLSPYLALPGSAGPPETGTVIEWPDRGAPAYRVVINDLSLGGEIVVRAGVRDTKFILDTATLDVRHVYRYRLEAWLGERWTPVTSSNPFPRTPEGQFVRHIVVEYRDPQAFDQALDSIPARGLEGERLDSGWIVTKRLRSLSSKGSRRTTTYLADHRDKGEGFLKAFDFSTARDASHPAESLEELTRDYEDECRILDWCVTKRMTHVVRMYDRGIYGGAAEPISVPYIVYERASTDLLTALRDAGTIKTGWALRVLHQVAIGLNQLHVEGIAHLDIKAANILIFDDGSAKIADLALPCYRTRKPPGHVPLADQWWPPDLPVSDQWWPPEWLYRPGPPNDWRIRCQACDLYQFGSLIRFVFSRPGTSQFATPAMLARLDLAHHPYAAGSDFRSSLPFIREAFAQVGREFEEALTESSIGDLAKMFRELCDPDPYLRGDPQAQGQLSEQYSLAGYVGRLELLARRVESG